MGAWRLSGKREFGDRVAPLRGLSARFAAPDRQYFDDWDSMALQIASAFGALQSRVLDMAQAANRGSN
ncbi:hypothetical protein C7S18_08040 [Ahniella affigens]|uniref:Uncharacterized protein n=1 Tax=Ahniella affigens TaxID=2021234 RepID=A0A2P1PQL9_9GAMM|nr:hypothetical protein C7S18_08040 [Ahniella affigens]